MRFCSKCFTELPNGANYCPVCGECMKEIEVIETKTRREKLTSLHISMENRKGVCKVNGEDVSSTTSHLELVFDNGEWSLMISEDTLYTSNDQKVTE